MADDKNYEIIESLGIIGRKKNGITKQLVFAQWFDKPPVYEIREFASDGKPLARRGMSSEELENLKEILLNI